AIVPRTMGQGTSPIDRNRDGIPDFNDGIGRVIINGTDVRSSITVIGGNLDPTTAAFIVSDGPGGFTQNSPGNFGFELVGNPPVAVGLPPVGVSFTLGSPFIRNNTGGTQQYYYGALGALDFNRPNQGLFVNTTSIGSALLSGAIFGSSRIDGAVSRYSAGFQAGSLRVDGDV